MSSAFLLSVYVSHLRCVHGQMLGHHDEVGLALVALGARPDVASCGWVVVMTSGRLSVHAVPRRKCYFVSQF